MGTAKKVIVKRDSEVFELTKVGESHNLLGGEKIIAVSEDGSETLLRKITEKQVLNSGGDIYKDPSTLSKNDLNITSISNYYDGSSTEDRLIGTKEKIKLNFKDKYDPSDFSYTWDDTCTYNCWANYWTNSYNVKNKNYNQATYNYTSTSYGDTAAPKVVISIPNSSTSYSFSLSKYKITQPITKVDFASNESHYSTSEDRIVGTKENWEVTNITLHTKVSDILGENTPSNLSDYEYRDWHDTCTTNCFANYWTNSYNVVSSNGHKATYEYTKTSSGSKAAPDVDISIPGIETSQSFNPTKYKLTPPINSVSFSGNLSGTKRNVSEVEKWQVTNVTNHPKVSEVLDDPPSTVSDYNYTNWGDSCTYNCWANYWTGSYNIVSTNDYEATYEYVEESYGDKGAPDVKVSIPEINTSQSFNPSKYVIYP